MVPQEEIERFLLGEDEEKYIVSLEYDYKSSKIYKIIQDPVKGKLLRPDTFIPFAWVGDLKGKNFYKSDKHAQKRAMSENGIIIEKLDTHGDERLENGLKYIVKTTKTYSNLVNFFKGGGLDPWGRDNTDSIQILSPVEQYLVQKNKRLFKGFEEYDEIHRFVFDIETTGLDPKTSKIFLIGMKDNRGFIKLLSAQNEDEEKQMIVDFFKTIDDLKPSLVGGYNSAFFDFPFILKRAEILKVNIKKICKTLHPDYTLKQKDGILKLANEMEPYVQTQMWGYNIVDIAHAVRRAQAINSDIKSWSLKYITKFIEAEKPNRVYVEGDKIGKIYFENEEFWMNKENGAYKKVGFDSKIDEICSRRDDVYKLVTGSKIIEDYLDDDLYETMIVDEQFNQANFLLSKLVPTTYERLSTMGTATLWKMIMASWSYKHNLALPKKLEKRKFTGGLIKIGSSWVF
jgi:DNA polymerase elongation subunit (family B)